jgi:hypothetical protein
MTRVDIKLDYQIDERGVIRSPGKFEGEMLYVPYFWDAFLNGCADGDDGEVLTFIVDSDDVREFPELADAKQVRLYEDSQGFVGEI